MNKGVEEAATNLSDDYTQKLYALNLPFLKLFLNLTVLRVSYYYGCRCYSHFIDGKTEALRSCC